MIQPNATWETPEEEQEEEDEDLEEERKITEEKEDEEDEDDEDYERGIAPLGERVPVVNAMAAWPPSHSVSRDRNYFADVFLRRATAPSRAQTRQHHGVGFRLRHGGDHDGAVRQAIRMLRRSHRRHWD